MWLKNQVITSGADPDHDPGQGIFKGYTGCAKKVTPVNCVNIMSYKI